MSNGNYWQCKKCGSVYHQAFSPWSCSNCGGSDFRMTGSTANLFSDCHGISDYIFTLIGGLIGIALVFMFRMIKSSVVYIWRQINKMVKKE